MDGWDIPCRQLLWQLGQVTEDDNPLRLKFEREPIDLPPLSWAEALYAEYQLLGLSIGDHIMMLYRPLLTGILSSLELAQQNHNTLVKVVGPVVMHQAPPTAKGHHFVTLEDEESMVNIIIGPDVYAQYEQIVRESPLLIVEGTVQKKDNVINVLMRSASRLSVL